MILLNHDLSINEAHEKLALWDKAYAKVIASGQGQCVWCGQLGRNHLPDQRCTSSDCSQKFRYIGQDKADKVKKAIELIEGLLAL
jgi:hypothetical protein